MVPHPASLCHCGERQETGSVKIFSGEQAIKSIQFPAISSGHRFNLLVYLDIILSIAKDNHVPWDITLLRNGY